MAKPRKKEEVKKFPCYLEDIIAPQGRVLLDELPAA